MAVYIYVAPRLDFLTEELAYVSNTGRNRNDCTNNSREASLNERSL